jgi:hypothetical protein
MNWVSSLYRKVFPKKEEEPVLKTYTTGAAEEWWERTNQYEKLGRVSGVYDIRFEYACTEEDKAAAIQKGYEEDPAHLGTFYKVILLPLDPSKGEKNK